MRIRSPREFSFAELTTIVALGLLIAFLLRDLGLFDVLGFHWLGAWITLCVVVAALLAVVGWTRALMAGTATLIVVYLVIAFTPIVNGPVERWIRSDPLPRQPLDAVVVLASWVQADSSLDAIGFERLTTGLELVKAGVAPRIITTRVIAYIDGRRMTADPGVRRMIHLADLDSQWTEVDSVGVTHDEATRVAALLGPGTHRIALVTSPMHTRRACAVFEGVGFVVTCVPSRETTHQTRHPVGAGDHLQAFAEYLYERLGMVKYKYNGWIH